MACSLKTTFCNPLHAGTRPTRLHNERKGIYRARGELIRNIDGPIHRTAMQRWEANAHNYRRKSRALKNLLRSVGGDWNQLTVVD